MSVNILLDTNFVLLPLKLGKDIKSELDSLIDFNYSILILDVCIEEMEKIASKYNIKNMSITLQKLWPNIKVIPSNIPDISDIDEKIFFIALKNNYIVATNDMALRRKLKKHGLPTIFLKQRGHLALDTPKPLSEYSTNKNR